MKKGLLAILAIVALMTGCATSAEKMARQAEVAAQVKEALQARHYKIDVHMMYPRRGSSVNVSSNYSLEVKGDTLVSYLPYFGRAYNVPYGGGKGLNFKALITGYRSEPGNKGLTRIQISTENEEDQYLYYLEIFNNGEATIDVQSRQREFITYSGRMDLY